MWPSNPLTERLQLKWPIIQARMGIMSTSALAGQSAGMVRHRTAADLVHTLAEDALRRLRSFG